MHRRRKRNIVIELTALLDVIMIMIFMVMSENSKLIKEQIAAAQQEASTKADEEIDDLTAQLAEALAQLEEGDREELLYKLQNAESQLKSYHAMDDIITVLTVELENRANNTVRRLTFGKSDDLTVKDNRSDSEFQTSINQLAVFISDAIKEDTTAANSHMVYIVFTFDSDNIYLSDFKAIDSILKNVDATIIYPKGDSTHIN